MNGAQAELCGPKRTGAFWPMLSTYGGSRGVLKVSTAMCAGAHLSPQYVGGGGKRSGM